MKPTPILVTGSHRSGTTWVGKTISFSNQVQYIPDTFAPNGTIRKQKLFDVWFKYLNESNDQKYYWRLKRLFQFQYSLQEALHLKDDAGKFDYRNTPARLQFYRDIQYNKLLKKSPRPLLKDPIAIFSAEWIHHNFQSQNIILIRHPAAFVSSLIRMNWRFDFRNFTRQPRLMGKYFTSLKKHLSNPPTDPIIEGSLLWICIHIVIKEYQIKYPHWFYCKHEDLSADPIAKFQAIFQWLRLDFTEKIRRKISLMTASSNPAEVQKAGRIHQLKRNSKANIKIWKSRLTTEEINTIREWTEPVAHAFYSDDDW
jgi:hypothetical protein